MANYKFKAISFEGEEVEGVVKAKDADTAVIELKQQVATVNSIKEVKETPQFIEGLFKPKISEKELAFVCEQLSIILSAGLPITTGIKLVANQTEDKYLKALLTDVCEDVKSGSSLAAAFENRDDRLPTTFIESIRAGETSGRIERTFKRLSNYFESRSDVAEKVKSALIYPAFVIVLAIIVIALIMIFAVPVFTESFASFGIELPFPTRALIATSNFFRKWTWLIIIIVVALVIAYNVYRSTDAGHYKTDQWKLKMPIVGKVRMMTAASEFANSFNTMVSSGLPIVKALNITGKSISNYSIAQDVLEASGLVEGGAKIGASLKQKTNLPDLLTEVVGIGEESGSMEKVLTAISIYYDKEAEITTTKAIKVLEPSIIIVLAFFVVFILLAVYLPMFSLYGNIA